MKIRFVGYYRDFYRTEVPIENISYRNYLFYPLKRLIDMLRTDYGIVTTYSDDFDIIVFCDLDQELWDYAQSLPKKIKKILVLTESVIYTPFVHHFSILSHPMWTYVVSYNKEYHTNNMIYYDIPVTGIQLPIHLQPQSKEEGCYVANYKQDKHGYTAERDTLIRRLALENKIHVYGANWELKKSYFGTTDDKIHTISGYRYYIALENAKYSGYVTEKIADAILAEVPSLYFGDTETAKRRFGNTFVPLNGLTCRDFDEALRELNQNYDLYKQNVIQEKKNSMYWCDSYHNAMIQAVTQ